MGLRSPDPAGQKAEDLLEEEVSGKAFFRSLALSGSREATVMMTDRGEDREKWSKEVRESVREGRAAVRLRAV